MTFSVKENKAQQEAEEENDPITKSSFPPISFLPFVSRHF